MLAKKINWQTSKMGDDHIDNLHVWWLEHTYCGADDKCHII